MDFFIEMKHLPFKQSFLLARVGSYWYNELRY